MPPRSVNWIAIRTAYVVKGWSAQKCADEFSVDPTTIRKRASKEAWTAERHKNTTAAATVATETARAIVAEIAASATASHLAAADEMLAIARGSLADLKDITNARTRIAARKDAIEGFERALRSHRLILGLREGQASDSERDSDGGIPEFVEFESPAPPDNLEQASSA